MKHFLRFSLLAFSSLSSYVDALPTTTTTTEPSSATDAPSATITPVERAIVPTTTGQTGVSLVSVTMSLPYANITYQSVPGEFTMKDSTLAWTAAETTAITQVVTTTQSGKTSVVTNLAPVVVSSAANNAGLQVFMTPELVNEFKSIVASTACGKRKRSSSCGLGNYMTDVVNGINENNNLLLVQADNALPAGRNLINPVGEGFRNLIDFLELNAIAITPQMAAGAGVVALAYWVYQFEVIPLAFEIPASIIATTTTKTTTTTTTTQTGCPTNAPTGINKPLCSACSGNQQFVCQSGQYKYCDCIPEGPIIFNQLNRTYVDLQQQIIVAVEAAYAAEIAKPKVTCSSNNTNDALAVDITFVQLLTTQFCKGDLTKALSKDMTNKDINSLQNSGYTFQLGYTPGTSTCQIDCASAFKQLTTGCQGKDGNSIQKSGRIALNCGAKYNYTVTPPPKPATAPDGKSTISQQACQSNTNTSTPTFTRSDALTVISELCKNQLEGNKEGCIQVADKGIFAQAWVQPDAPPLVACQAWPFNSQDYSYTYASDFEQMCTWALTSAIDDCDTNTVDKKFGGRNQVNCVNYLIFGENSPADYSNNLCPWAETS